MKDSTPGSFLLESQEGILAANHPVLKIWEPFKIYLVDKCYILHATLNPDKNSMVGQTWSLPSWNLQSNHTNQFTNENYDVCYLNRNAHGVKKGL